MPPKRLTVLIVVIAALAAFLFSGPLQAQEGTGYEYVDLLVTYEYDVHKVAYSVRNIGTATATGVTVSFLLEDLLTNNFEVSPTQAPPPPTDKRTVNSTDQRFTWEVGTLLPGASSGSLKFSTSNHSGHSTAKRIGVITATASSDQPEPVILLASNVTKVYSYASSTTGASLHMSGNRLGLLLSVGDLRPAAGGNVSFALTAINLNEASRHY